MDEGTSTRRGFGKAALAASIGFLSPAASPAQDQAVTRSIKNVVLVHGAFADGSSWSRVIPLLEAKGFNVTAVQNPLTSLAEDVTTTRRMLARQNGPTILVGHSYAGFVITEAGNAPNVSALVYISSYGPAEGETHDDLVKRYPAASGVSAIHPDADAFLWIDRGKFGQVFAHDVDPAQVDIMAAVQKPIAKKAFAAPIQQAAWKSRPSWFLLSENDRLINPDLQRFMTRRMGAKVVSVPSSHASLVSHPVEAAQLIESASA